MFRLPWTNIGTGAIEHVESSWILILEILRIDLHISNKQIKTIGIVVRHSSAAVHKLIDLYISIRL